MNKMKLFQTKFSDEILYELTHLLSALHLDKSSLNLEDFKVYVNDSNMLIGFVRVEEKENYIELRNLGISPQFQGMGLGLSVLKDLLSKRDKIVYVCTVKGRFFRKAGFTICYNNIPSDLLKKISFAQQFHPGEQVEVLKFGGL